MNGKSNTPKNQVGNRGGRIGRRGGKGKHNDVVVLSPEQEAAMKEKAAEISNGLQSFTWRDLESKGKFSRNEKLTFIRDDMLIVGCDIGSETHYVRAIDTKGRELSQGAFSFENNATGFQSAKDWALQLAAQHEKNQIVLGLEPTGHYWFSLAAWMIANAGQSVCGKADKRAGGQQPGKERRQGSEIDRGFGEERQLRYAISS